MGGAMIQYYRDLMATVTYDMVEKFISNLEYGFCASFGNIENMFICNRQLFFEKLSEQVNKPIEHIVHEMKNLQPDISKILFTEENLSKIHISQFIQFLNGRQVPNQSVLDEGTVWVKGKRVKVITVFLYPEQDIYTPTFDFYFKSGKYIADANYGMWRVFFNRIGGEILKDGDLTQFHVLFTEVYNEIIGYPIK